MACKAVTPPFEGISFRTQAFGPLTPGPILHDFQALLGVADAGDLKVSPATGHPTEPTVAALNARMHRPLRLDQKRSRLPSYPHLQILLLCARVCSFLTTGGDDRGAARPVPAALTRWAELNDTERYFSLLAESFFTFDDPLGGRSTSNLPIWVVAQHGRIPRGGLRPDLASVKQPAQRYALQAVPLAYLDLFGLARVEHAAHPLPAWMPAGLDHTPFGDDLIAVLRGAAGELFGVGPFEEGPSAAERLQRILAPYFPAFQKTLHVEIPVIRREGVYVFKASHGKAWRRLALPHKATLHRLADEILGAFDFDHDHLYSFTFRGRGGRRVELLSPDCDEGPCAAEVELAELPIDPGDDMAFLFDFGDCWRFNVRLEEVRPVGSIKKLPAVLESHGKAPVQYPNFDD